MNKTCSKCGIKTEYDDDLHCRIIFKETILEFLWLDKIEEAKNLFNSIGFEEEWKTSLLKYFRKEGIQNFKKLDNLIKKQKEEEEKFKQEDLEKRKKEQAIEKHKEYFEMLKIQYPGLSIVKQPSPELHRITYCYRCRESLDNSINIECNSCHWIICYCGACGCNYNK